MTSIDCACGIRYTTHSKTCM